jgi:hypothetical protein
LHSGDSVTLNELMVIGQKIKTLEETKTQKYIKTVHKSKKKKSVFMFP